MSSQGLPPGSASDSVSQAFRPSLTTSERMHRVRQRDTTPELAVRRILRQLGRRYRVCSAGLPGRPDISNQRHRWAIFVHGCFWHSHHGCRLAKIPTTNPEFWRVKFDANQRRDAVNADSLRALGFRVLVVWQCDLRDPQRLEASLNTFLREADDA